MTHSQFLRAALITVVLVVPVAGARAQHPTSLIPSTHADELLALGRWSEAEEMYYAQARPRPRDPVPRAALGRYLAMKGALLPGIVLLQEAQEFGLDPRVTRELLTPWRTVQRWRGSMIWPVDSAITVRPVVRDSTALFQVPLPAAATSKRRGTRRVQWVEVVPRIAGYDSTSTPRLIGMEALERMVPSYDMLSHQLTLYSDPRVALRATGRRYNVLRDEAGVYVLVTPDRAEPMMPALKELGARWWQLDLAHGLLVVR